MSLLSLSPTSSLAATDPGSLQQQNDNRSRLGAFSNNSSKGTGTVGGEVATQAHVWGPRAELRVRGCVKAYKFSANGCRCVHFSPLVDGWSVGQLRRGRAAIRRQGEEIISHDGGGGGSKAARRVLKGRGCT